MIHCKTSTCELLKLFMGVSSSVRGDCRRHFLTHIHCLDDCGKFFDTLQFRIPYPMHVFKFVLQQFERKLHDLSVVRDVQLSYWPEGASLQQRLCLMRLVPGHGCDILGLLLRQLIIISVVDMVLLMYQYVIICFFGSSKSIFRGDLTCPGGLKVPTNFLRD